jgi:biotin carboxyl carrier protein
MKLTLTISQPRASAANRATHCVEVLRLGSEVRVGSSSPPIVADVRRVEDGTYSVLLDGRSFLARVERATSGMRVCIGRHEFRIEVHDPRQWQRPRSGTLEAQGRQEIVAPMPGKVARVLVEQGARIEAGQGLVVVEAMKMQNEIRSPKSGTVERLLVREGQAVNAGETLAVVI